MTHQRLQLIAFLILFVAVGVIAILIWWPYLTLLFIAIILAILFRPVYEWLVKKFKSESFAAILTIVLILIIVIGPLYLMGQLVFYELIGLYNQIKGSGVSISQTELVASLPGQMQPVATNLLADLGNKLAQVASSTFQSVTSVLSNVAGFFLSFFLVFFTVYYLLRDGKKIKKYINTVFPLSTEHEDVLVGKLESSVSGVVKGAFLVALIQGIIATVGYLIFGLPNAFLWGSFTVLAALVPTVGTSLALIPAVAFLFLTGHTGAGVGLAIWGIAAVSTIDNIVGPKLIGSKTHLHPMLVLFSILGGIQMFGFVGFLLGPILMAIFVTLLDIYRQDLKAYMGK